MKQWRDKTKETVGVWFLCILGNLKTKNLDTGVLTRHRVENFYRESTVQRTKGRGGMYRVPTKSLIIIMLLGVQVVSSFRWWRFTDCKMWSVKLQIFHIMICRMASQHAITDNVNSNVCVYTPPWRITQSPLAAPLRDHVRSATTVPRTAGT